MFNYKKLLRKPEIDMPEDEIMQELVYYVKTSNAIVCKWVGGGEEREIERKRSTVGMDQWHSTLGFASNSAWITLSLQVKNQPTTI